MSHMVPGHYLKMSKANPAYAWIMSVRSAIHLMQYYLLPKTENNFNGAQLMNDINSLRPGEFVWQCGYLLTMVEVMVIVRRAGLLWSQQDFEWRWSVPLFKCLTVLEFSFILFDFEPLAYCLLDNLGWNLVPNLQISLWRQEGITWA